MNIEDRLNIVADRYRNLGFTVVLHPKAGDLPAFAKDFKVQVLATKGDVTVVYGEFPHFEVVASMGPQSENCG